jgi:hypothetical protein
MVLINLTSTTGLLETDWDQIVLLIDGQDTGDLAANTTHRSSNGTDHANVVLNDVHRGSDGKNHSDVVLNNTHRTSNGTDHTFINQDVTTTGTPSFSSVTTDSVNIKNNIVEESTTARTIGLTDSGKLIKCTNVGATTITVPPNSTTAFDVGNEIEIVMYAAGQVTIAAGAGVTINSKDSLLDINGQYASVALKKIATDEWLLIGDLA